MKRLRPRPDRRAPPRRVCEGAVALFEFRERAQRFVEGSAEFAGFDHRNRHRREVAGMGASAAESAVPPSTSAATDANVSANAPLRFDASSCRVRAERACPQPTNAPNDRKNTGRAPPNRAQRRRNVHAPPIVAAVSRVVTNTFRARKCDAAASREAASIEPCKRRPSAARPA